MVTRYTANKKINFCLSFTLFFFRFVLPENEIFCRNENETKRKTFNESMNLFVCL